MSDQKQIDLTHFDGHTEGPWCATNGFFGNNIYPAGDKQARKHIAEICPEGIGNGACDITATEAKANSRLIAAAPDLLALARRMVAELKATIIPGECYFEYFGYCRTHEQHYCRQTPIKALLRDIEGSDAK